MASPILATLCAAALLGACASAPAALLPAGTVSPLETTESKQPDQQPAAAPIAEGTPPDCNAVNTYDANKGWFRSNSEIASPDCRSEYLIRRGKDVDAPMDNTDFFKQRDKTIDQTIDRQYRNLNSGGQ
ncbi:MAG: hypothetical protein ACYC7L_00140 [Nitrospirota bacterium]